MSQSLFSKYKYLAPLLAMLTAALIWLLWVMNPVSNINGPSGVPDKERPSTRQIYYGPRHSIAILPFIDTSPDNDQAFLSDGLSAELIDLFTQIQGLQVSSHTSSLFFRDPAADVSVIGQRLRTSQLLLGEVQMQSGQLLLGVRLWNTRQNREIWASEYRIGIAGVFGWQEELVETVLAELNFGVPAELPAARPVVSDAWLDYLRGRWLSEQRSAELLPEAQGALRKAIDIEAEYEKALLRLAESQLAASLNGIPFESETARATLNRLLSINPDYAPGLGLLSYVQRNLDWEWEAAAESARRAVDLRPGSADLLSTLSLALFTLGRFDEAETYLRASIERDPLNLHRRLRLGLLQEFAGQFDDSLSTYRQIMSMNPDYPGLHAYRARVKVLQDKPESALEESEKESDPFWSLYARILALEAMGRDDEVIPLLEQKMEDSGGKAAYQVAEIMALRGDPDSSFEWLRRAQDQRDGGMAELLGNAFLEPLHSDTRWTALLAELGLPLDAGD